MDGCVILKWKLKLKHARVSSSAVRDHGHCPLLLVLISRKHQSWKRFKGLPLAKFPKAGSDVGPISYIVNIKSTWKAIESYA